MKKIISVLILLTSLSVNAQKPCEIDANINDTLGFYKTTKAYTVFERNFAGNTTNISFSLTNTNGVVGLDVQQLQLSYDFLKANCFDKNSKIYLQLSNGKIVSLMFVGNETCGTLIRNEKNQNIRILSGSFVFVKENFEDLKTAKITFIRLKFAGETVDYPFKTGFVSELDKTMYEPENYFINYMKCIED